MRFAIIVSQLDKAGLNIKQNLLTSFNFVKSKDSISSNEVYESINTLHEIKIYTINCDSIDFMDADDLIIADFFIFATKHQSKSGQKTLSVHFPGNLSSADFGGKVGKLCMSCPSILKTSFIILNQFGKNMDYEISLEATHHGPLVKTPCMFIEIGSSVDQWTDNNAGSIISKTIMQTINEYCNKKYDVAIAFGGRHYCSGFNKVELLSEIAISHICPKYEFDNLTVEMINEMINLTTDKVNFALIDWKGLNSLQRTKLIELLESIKLPWKKTKEFKTFN